MPPKEASSKQGPLTAREAEFLAAAFQCLKGVGPEGPQVHIPTLPFVNQDLANPI